MKPPKRILDHAKSLAQYGPGMFRNIADFEHQIQHHRDEILSRIKHYKEMKKELEELRSEQREVAEWLTSIGEDPQGA